MHSYSSILFLVGLYVYYILVWTLDTVAFDICFLKNKRWDEMRSCLGSNSWLVQERKGKEEYLYSAILADIPLTKRSGMDHTDHTCKLHHICGWKTTWNITHKIMHQRLQMNANTSRWKQEMKPVNVVDDEDRWTALHLSLDDIAQLQEHSHSMNTASCDNTQGSWC